MLDAVVIKKFQTKILSWYKENKRDLPWRKTRDPYKILVSEIMLQQTQVNRVIPKYEAWLQAFPTVEALVQAKTADVLRLWSGLGYNRRALYLQKAAKQIVISNEMRDLTEISHPHSGIRNDNGTYFPQTIEALKKLPGIGVYTAAAVACFAFDTQVAVVDTNIRKVILTQFNYCHCEKSVKTTKQSHGLDCSASLAMTDTELQKVADALLPVGLAYEWNQALMDYASALLKKEILQSRTKQSKFKGSDRYYRGQIVKLLIEKQNIKISKLAEIFEKDEVFVETIIKGLEKDGMVRKEKDIVFLK